MTWRLENDEYEGCLLSFGDHAGEEVRNVMFLEC
jgi:hypothetical protein